MDTARTWPALDVSGLLRLTGGGETAAERLHAILADFDLTAIDERSPDLWRVFFRTETDRDRATATIRVELPDLSAEPVDVEDEDWAARSQASLRAIRVGRIVIAPPWNVPGGRDAQGGDAGTLVIVIQPSMGFGTGHHATTRLCLAALQQVDVSGQAVIDVGCGSGVLAIAASLLGAGDVVGFDDDADALGAARENLTLNPRARVMLTAGSLGTIPIAPADVVLANLTGGLLVSAAADLRRLVAPGGHLVVSGFMSQEADGVRGAFAALRVERRGDEDGWGCLTLRA